MAGTSFRPISNLPVLSKLLERLVHQLMNYLTLNNLLPSLQSGFRPGHSTETANPPSYLCCLRLYRPLTVEILLRWFFRICLQHSTRSTTKYSCSAYV